jgi:hypothetical protein
VNFGPKELSLPQKYLNFGSMGLKTYFVSGELSKNVKANTF